MDRRAMGEPARGARQRLITDNKHQGATTRVRLLADARTGLTAFPKKRFPVIHPSRRRGNRRAILQSQ